MKRIKTLSIEYLFIYLRNMEYILCNCNNYNYNKNTRFTVE